MTTNELLDLVRARHSLRSEHALADTLGISGAALKHHRKTGPPLDIDLAWRIAELLELPPAEVIAVMSFETETDPGRRLRWRERLRAMGVLRDDD